MLDRRLVGRTTAPGKNLVERGAVRRFAESLGEQSPVHRSERAARALGYPGIIAPPTFAVTFEAGSDLREILGLAHGSVLLAEQVFEYERPIVVGETILVTQRVDEISSRDGISGAMELVVVSETGRLASGDVVYRARHQLVVRV